MNAISVQTVGNWRSEVGVPLEEAIRTSMAVMGRTAEDSTKQAIVLMSQSARAITPKAKARRVQMQSTTFGPYLIDWRGAFARQGASRNIYKMWFEPSYSPDSLADEQAKRLVVALRTSGSTYEEQRRIKMAGMAKDSWLWGIKKLTKSTASTKFTDLKRVVTAGKTITKGKEYGHWVNNRVSYIVSILPSGWERLVELAAGNKMMAQARKRLEQDFKSSMARASARGRSGASAIGRLFR